MARAAVVKGVFLRPGISKNGRKYTPQNIGNAVARMKEAIKGGDLPITMATSHGAAASDDALSTIGMVTSVEQLSDGSGYFEADIANTTAGKDIAALVVPDSEGKRFIRGISIRGRWMTDPVTVEGAETADDLMVGGIDFTHSPGVTGAEIIDAALAESAAVAGMIYESVEEAEFLDEANKAPYGNVTYADPGYQADKKKRYPIDTEDHVRAAWAYINKSKNASAYTSNQLKRVKSRIKSAAKKFKIDIQAESALLVNELQEVLEAYASTCIDNGAASISVSGYTDDAGKLSPLAARLAYAAIVALHAVDPDMDGDVDLVMPDGTSRSSSSGEATRPDDDEMEGDFGGGTGDSTIDADAAVMNCVHCGEPVDDSAMYCPMCGQPIDQVGSDGPSASKESQEATVPTETEIAEAAAVAEAAAKAAEEAAAVEAAPASKGLSPEDIKALSEATATATASALAPVLEALAKAAAPAAAAPSVTEADAAAKAAADAAAAEAAAVAEATATAENASLEQLNEAIETAKAEARAQAIDEAVAEFRKGPGGRKGLTSGTRPAATAGFGGGLDESADSVTQARQIAEMSNQEFLAYSGKVWASQPLGKRVEEFAASRGASQMHTS